jgi:hypothetical protein
MKIAITGHTKGIGKSIFDYYANKYDVKGFSRSTGFDITKDVSKILEESSDCNIFINNAWHSAGQLDLLLKWFSENENKNRLIINIGSVAPTTYRNLNLHPKMVITEYLKSKTKLEKINEELNNSFSRTKSSILSLGVVDTENGHPAVLNDFRSRNDCVTLESINTSLDFIINQFAQDIHISYLTISNWTPLPLKD